MKKTHKFCKVSNAFLISIELGSIIESSNILIPSCSSSSFKFEWDCRIWSFVTWYCLLLHHSMKLQVTVVLEELKSLVSLLPDPTMLSFPNQASAVISF